MEEKEITNARCEYCKEIVEPDIHFGQTWKGTGETFVHNNICCSWSCKNHGSVGAKIGKKYYRTPFDLFKEIIIMDKSLSTSSNDEGT